MSKELRPFFHAFLALACAAGFVAPSSSAHAWQRIGVFHALFGLASGALLIVLSKALWTLLGGRGDD